MDKTLEQAILDGIDTVSGFAITVDPAIAPLVIIGQGVAHLIPTIVDDVNALLAKKDPTAEDAAALAAKIRGLLNPSQL